MKKIKQMQSNMRTIANVIIILVLLIPFMPVLVALAEEVIPPMWKCYTAVYIVGSTRYNDGCVRVPIPDSTPKMVLVYGQTWTDNNNPGTIGRARLTCDQPECEMPASIYVTIQATVQWIPPGNIPGDRKIHVRLWNEAGDLANVTGGECTDTQCDINETIILDASSTWWDGTGRIYVNMDGGGHYSTNVWGIIELSVAVASPSCEYTTVRELAHENYIDPAIELPAGVPDDEQVIDVSDIDATTVMKLVTYGGPWFDGTNIDRYDTAVSFDEGVTWIHIRDISAICQVADPINPDLRTIYFTFPMGTTSFRIRAADDPGDFEDNTDTEPGTFPMYFNLESTMPGTRTGCGSEFVIDWDHPLITETVDATDAVGVQVSYYPGITTTDVEWFVLIIDPATSEGWTTPEISPDIEQVIQMRYDTETSWHSMTPSNADEYHIWCGEWEDEPNGIQSYYFMPFERWGYYRVDDTFGTGIDLDFADNSGSVTFTIYPVTRTRALSGCEIAYKLGTKIQEWTVDATAMYGHRALKDWSGFPAPPPGGIGGETARPRGVIAVDTYGLPFYDPDCNGCFQFGGNGGFNWNYRAGLSMQTFDFDNDTIEDIIYGNQHILWYLEQFDLGLLDWYKQEEHPKLLCAVKLDPYHLRTYLDIDIDNTEALFIRAQEGGYGYADNSGFLSYRIWEATEFDFHDPGDPPLPPGGCSEAFTLGSKIADLFIDARVDDGALIPTEPELYYAVETKNGPWKEGGAGDDLYGLQLGSDSDWDTIIDSSRVLCVEEVEEDSPYLRLYIRGNLGTAHRLRVDDSDIINWSINTGSMGADVYGALTAGDPWEDCADEFPDLSTIPTIGEYTIPANSQTGTQVPALRPGYAYAIAVTGGDWVDLPDGLLDPRRDVQVSNDNGAVWTPQDEFDFVCSQMRNGYLRFYFTYEGGDVWRLRVNDDGDAPGGETLDWIMNTGELTFKLYSTNQEVDLPPGDLDMYCNSTGCERPTNWLDIGAWVEYGRCSIMRYIAWCPRHTDALIAISGIGRHYEPWASIIGMIDILDYIRDEIRAYVWTRDDPLDPLSANDGQARGAVDDLVRSGNRNSPWNGGQLYFGDSGEFSAATTNCTNAFATIIGTGGNAFRAFCWTTGMMKIVNIQWPFLNIIISAAAIIFFMVYISKAWINQGQK